MDQSISSISTQTITVRQRKAPGEIILAILSLFCALTGGYKSFFLHWSFSYFDVALYPLAVVLWIFMLVKLFSGTTTFTVTAGQLIVTSKPSIFNSTDKYNLAEIENLGPEYDIRSKAPLGIGYGEIQIFSHRYNAVTFDYHNKRIMLGLDLVKFDMQSLVDMMVANHPEILE